MAGRFKYDNKVFEVINVIVDLLVLGFFWIITSIPIFTMGASTTALYYTVNKSIRNKKGYAYREYWKAFKRNFKQATLCFLMWFVVAIFLAGITSGYTAWSVILFLPCTCRCSACMGVLFIFIYSKI